MFLSSGNSLCWPPDPTSSSSVAQTSSLPSQTLRAYADAASFATVGSWRVSQKSTG